MINWSNPWDILGWGLIGYIALLVIVVPVFVLAYSSTKTILESRRLKRAHAGKLTCEQKECKLKATRRTPNGFFCEDHFRPNSDKILGQFLGTFSFAFPLDYMREKK